MKLVSAVLLLSLAATPFAADLECADGHCQPVCKVKGCDLADLCSGDVENPPQCDCDKYCEDNKPEGPPSGGDKPDVCYNDVWGAECHQCIFKDNLVCYTFDSQESCEANHPNMVWCGGSEAASASVGFLERKVHFGEPDCSHCNCDSRNRAMLELGSKPQCSEEHLVPEGCTVIHFCMQWEECKCSSFCSTGSSGDKCYDVCDC